MDTLRSVSHLQRELGDKLFSALINSDNTGKVREFCESLRALPTEITLGGHTYELLSVLQDGEHRVTGDIVVERAAEMKANTGREDARQLYRNIKDIPKELRGRVCIAFLDWRSESDSREVYCYRWVDGRWIHEEHDLEADWFPSTRVLRRKS